MSSIFDRVTKSLDEAIKIEKGELTGRRQTVTVNPVLEFQSGDIKDIRNSLRMTQISFAALLGVTKKSVEAWEAGTNKPNGSARRLLELLNLDHDLPKQYHIIE